MAMKKKLRLIALALITFGVLGILMVISVGAFGLGTPNCVFLQGVCRYDPRTQQPSSFFIKQSPEPFVTQYIEEQIKQLGTFPLSAGSDVASITPVFVAAQGFNSDWNVTADVSVEIKYRDGHSYKPTFHVFAQGGNEFLGNKNTIMEAQFVPLATCDQPSTGVTWLCHY